MNNRCRRFCRRKGKLQYFDGKEKIYEDLAVENSTLFTFNNHSSIATFVNRF